MQDSTGTPTVPPKKRKRAHQSAASPAPSDPSNNNSNNPNGTSTELLASRADLSSRPILSISRGPTFIPTAEGSEYYKTDLIGINRVGFRYVPAGINPPGHAVPCRTIESNPTCFRISWEDRSPFLKVTKDGLGIAGSKGFRSARCNAPMREGKWYMEVTILHGGGEHVSEENHREGSHVRLGWGRREAPLNGPVGCDGYSYGYRDKTGDKVTISRPRPYGRPFGSGDVVGMYISLPPHRNADPRDPLDPAHIKRERIPIDLKGQEVFEILEYPQSKEMASLMDYGGKATSSASVPSTSGKKGGSGGKPERGGNTAGSAHTTSGKPPATVTTASHVLPTLKDSRIAFFVNGDCQGTAFSNLYDYLQPRQSSTQRKAKEKKRPAREGVKEHRENPFDDGTLGYYPFISLFNDASVRLNPGPDFAFPPPPDIDSALDGDTKAINPNSPVQTKERTWRPACERYAEFMAEQWALDALEEEEARVEAVQYAALERADEERKAERLKKRQQADAKRRAKKAMEFGVASRSSAAEEERSGLYPSPSPLRQTMAFDDGEGVTTTTMTTVEYENSSAPTPASVTEIQGMQSGYNSETPGDVDVDMEHEHEHNQDQRQELPHLQFDKDDEKDT